MQAINSDSVAKTASLSVLIMITNGAQFCQSRGPFACSTWMGTASSNGDMKAVHTHAKMLPRCTYRRKSLVGERPWGFFNQRHACLSLFRTSPRMREEMDAILTKYPAAVDGISENEDGFEKRYSE